MQKEFNINQNDDTNSYLLNEKTHQYNSLTEQFVHLESDNKKIQTTIA